jgi:hypothetical protein
VPVYALICWPWLQAQGPDECLYRAYGVDMQKTERLQAPVTRWLGWMIAVSEERDENSNALKLEGGAALKMWAPPFTLTMRKGKLPLRPKKIQAPGLPSILCNARVKRTENILPVVADKSDKPSRAGQTRAEQRLFAFCLSRALIQNSCSTAAEVATSFFLHISRTLSAAYLSFVLIFSRYPYLNSHVC